MSINYDRLSIRPGETADIAVGFSEAACFIGAAGRTMRAELLADGSMVQLYAEDGSKFSMPITMGEAGIYRDAAGWYHY